MSPYERVAESRIRPADRDPGATRPGLRGLIGGIAAPDPRLWVLSLAIIGLDAAWMRAIHMKAAPTGFAVAAVIVVVLLVAAACLATVKSDPPLRGMALASAFLITFTVPVAVLHVLAAGLGLPFVDDALARFEAGLGFDWTAHVAFLARHPTLSWWLALAYHSSGPQVGIVVIALSATRRLGRLWAYARLFSVTLLCVIVVASLVPALGPYAHYAPRHVPAEHLETVGALWHLEPVARLRAGTLDTLALGDLRGLATFPSFHVCLAILTAWALAPLPVLGPLAILLNAAVIVATLGAGGHYLPDLLAGAALAVAAITVRERTRRRAPAAAPAGPVPGVISPADA
ncbi:phosphatase PAP2 family protein [Methylobacterium sp. J-030]|uniref:phosphatase PAP2 family protein n=1 Tax=Methylobacterium sp. J-030 TaxID=2836627 RepID=UPI001FBB06DF|nr:phosphatase PAP2 family protein [Methylobacterium sp. J-030]MCJ2072539.1 phosphatase PAP2 family protein [Methylobacterium sp. J-030]